MARTRSILHIRDSSVLAFTYRKNNPATGLYFDSTAITACTVEVRNMETSAVILAATAMTYVAGQDGYHYPWSYAALLNGVRAITVRFVPTRASTTPAALAPSTTEDYDLSDIMERVDEARVNDQTEHDATQAAIAAHEAARAAEAIVNQAEHDATQAAIAADSAGIEAKLVP